MFRLSHPRPFPARSSALRARAFTHVLLAAAWLLGFFARPLAAAPVEQAVLTEGAPYAANYGSALALSGNTLVVGRGGEEKVHVYVRSGSAWTQQAILTASNSDPGDRFGDAVAIDGDLIVVGALQERSAARGVNGDGTNNSAAEAGAAYIFKRSGTTWTQVAYLKPHVTYPFARFGCSVAISGTTVVVGMGYGKRFWTDPGQTTAGDGSPATGVDGDATLGGLTSAGAAYVYSLHGVEWRFDAYLKASNTGSFDQFGWAVAIDGDRIVVGANGEASAATGVNGNQADNSLPYAGAAYVFARTNGRWAQEAYLKCSTPQTAGGNGGIGFGGAVAIQGDTVAIGISGSGDYSNPGERIWIFTRSPAGVWAQQQALLPLVSGSWLGFSLALTGDTLVAGQIFEGPVPYDPTNHNGEAHVFTRQAGVWTRQAVIVPSNVRINAGAGFAVAADRGTLAIGCGQNDTEYIVGDNRVWIYTGAGRPNLVVEQPANTPLASGASRTIGALPGSFTDTVFTVRNTGGQPLTFTGAPNRVMLSGSSDFSVVAQPASPVATGASTTFIVRFAPATAGLRTATLTIPSDDPTAPFVIQLTGNAFSSTISSTGDGMSDAAKFRLAALGFDWQVAQPALVATYFANANLNGLYTTSQIQDLNVGIPLLTRNPTTGRFTLKVGVKQSPNLATTPFADFPLNTPGTTAVINGAGQLEFDFPASGNAAFFRVQSP
ncbi:MAG: choice-of-anchor D domain-containing protein [Verrucomicrobia bacterium]|nr:choice-of-anchor D domain-containing protein [Verrucomicrobiota bacterium]